MAYKGQKEILENIKQKRNSLQGLKVEYVDKFCHLGSIVATNGDTEIDVNIKGKMYKMEMFCQSHMLIQCTFLFVFSFHNRVCCCSS